MPDASRAGTLPVNTWNVDSKTDARIYRYNVFAGGNTLALGAAGAVGAFLTTPEAPPTVLSAVPEHGILDAPRGTGTAVYVVTGVVVAAGGGTITVYGAKFYAVPSGYKTARPTGHITTVETVGRPTGPATILVDPA